MTKKVAKDNEKVLRKKVFAGSCLSHSFSYNTVWPFAKWGRFYTPPWLNEIERWFMEKTLVTNFLGEVAIAKVVLRAYEKGIVVSKPLLECRYDLILDDGKTLYRTQVKYANGGHHKNSHGSISVGLKKCQGHGRRTIPCYTAREIDLLLVYIAKIDRVLAFGPEIFEGRGAIQIRLEPAQNNQVKRCWMAADYIW
jgi:hypothetical protein